MAFFFMIWIWAERYLCFYKQITKHENKMPNLYATFISLHSRTLFFVCSLWIQNVHNNTVVFHCPFWNCNLILRFFFLFRVNVWRVNVYRDGRQTKRSTHEHTILMLLTCACTATFRFFYSFTFCFFLMLNYSFFQI